MEAAAGLAMAVAREESKRTCYVGKEVRMVFQKRHKLCSPVHHASSLVFQSFLLRFWRCSLTYISNSLLLEICPPEASGSTGREWIMGMLDLDRC
ncbi:hypothetical protein GUJ93_ZPchr0009g2023 [Zizania palustris]|uniref:Uncharacterized protein n=1 Tax=Zizania palustris TaxID=103762 RepID=A0A8J5RGW6_ZIZPA|nr:hypothetical protein GUJ93_ZPchr0009g2023 [Zizania palustris]